MIKDKSEEEFEREEEDQASADLPSGEPAEELESGGSEQELTEVEADVQQVRLELDEYKNLYLRKAAEFENYKKRKQLEFQTLINSAEEVLISELLPILDDFERFEANAEGDRGSLLQGAQLIREKLWDVLSSRGLKPIDSVGAKFDPELHEALMQKEQDGVDPDIVLQEHQRGYRLGDKVIRHAKVVVSA